jgi:hypothetical protein
LYRPHVSTAAICFASRLPLVSIFTSLCDVRHAFPLGPVVLHDNRSTTNSRLERTASQIYRDTPLDWLAATTFARFRS